MYATSTRTELRLHRAVVNDDLNSLSHLLSDPTVDVNAVDENNLTPLIVAVLLNRIEAVKVLLTHKNIAVNMKYDDDTALHFAIRFQYLECVQALLGHKDTDTTLLSSRLFPPLSEAIYSDSMDCVALFLPIRARHASCRDFFGKTVLHTAVSSPLLLEHFLNTGLFCVSERNSAGETPLFSATHMSSPASFFLLLDEARTLLTAQDYAGRTVFHAAAEKTSLRRLSVLLHRNPLLMNVQDKRGATALHNTCLSFESATLSFLLSDASVLVNMEDENGQTRLHAAVIYAQLNMVKTLLAHKDTDVNVCDDKGRTPLHYAVLNINGSTYIIQALLSHKDIRVNIKDNEGKTPLALTRDIDDEEKDAVIALLLQKGASL